MEPKTFRQIGPQLPSSARMLDFGGQIRAFARKVKKRVGYVHKNVTIKLFNAVVFDTPVDTGAARGGWRPSVGGVQWAPSNRIDKTGGLVKKEIEVTITDDYGQVAFLSNAVGHIVPLEYGWSNKSPEGMVRINVARFQSLIKQTVAEAKQKVP